MSNSFQALQLANTYMVYLGLDLLRWHFQKLYNV